MSNLMLNAIRLCDPLKISPLNRFEASLKGGYGECERRLKWLILRHLSEGDLITYELVGVSETETVLKLYYTKGEIPKDISERLRDLIHSSEFKKGLKENLSYRAYENLFDGIVHAALKKAGFYYRGDKCFSYEDPDVHFIKRTILDVKDGDYYGTLYIDLRMLFSTLDKELLKEINANDFEKIINSEELRQRCLEVARGYIGKKVITLTVRGGYRCEHAFGEIVGVEEKTISDIKINEKDLHNIWLERYNALKEVQRFMGKSPCPCEYPVFLVKFERIEKPYYYPPSVLRVPSTFRFEPKARWERIMRNVETIRIALEELLRQIIGREMKTALFEFNEKDKEVGLKPVFYTRDSEKELAVKLSYGDSYKGAPFSPLVAFSKKGYSPRAGKCDISLLTLYPSTVQRKEIESLLEALSSLFKELKFGELRFDESNIIGYHYDPSDHIRSLNSFENALKEALTKGDPTRLFPFIIIPSHEDFYKVAKTEASKRGFHSQLLWLENALKIIESIDKIKETRPKLANICSGIYADFNIQKRVFKNELPGPLTWTLAEPADGEGKSLYVGFDISTKEGVAGAAFMVLDPFGSIIDATFLSLRAETLAYTHYRDAFMKLVQRAKTQGYERIVVMRDGIPRSLDELEESIKAFKDVTGSFGCRHLRLDYISVVKRSPVRIFRRSDEGKIENPPNGLYIYLHKFRHFGYDVHEIAVISSTKALKGTTRPVLLRVYEIGRKYSLDELKNIAEEYLALTRLNFWNLETGAHRLALPIKMADQIAYMLSMGIPLKSA